MHSTCPYLFAHLGPEGANIGETYIGLFLLGISLTMLCGCLIGMVKILNSLLGQRVRGIIENVINADIPVRGLGWLTGYLAMVVGAIMTILVQSSSVFTSTLTPLAGAGLLGTCLSPHPWLQPRHHNHLHPCQLCCWRGQGAECSADRTCPPSLQSDRHNPLLSAACHALADLNCEGAGQHNCTVPLVRRCLPLLHVLHLPPHHVRLEHVRQSGGDNLHPPPRHLARILCYCDKDADGLSKRPASSPPILGIPASPPSLPRPMGQCHRCCPWMLLFQEARTYKRRPGRSDHPQEEDEQWRSGLDSVERLPVRGLQEPAPPSSRQPHALLCFLFHRLPPETSTSAFLQLLLQLDPVHRLELQPAGSGGGKQEPDARGEFGGGEYSDRQQTAPLASEVDDSRAFTQLPYFPRHAPSNGVVGLVVIRIYNVCSSRCPVHYASK